MTARLNQSSGIHAVRLNNLPGDCWLVVSTTATLDIILQVVEELGKALEWLVLWRNALFTTERTESTEILIGFLYELRVLCGEVF